MDNRAYATEFMKFKVQVCSINSFARESRNVNEASLFATLIYRSNMGITSRHIYCYSLQNNNALIIRVVYHSHAGNAVVRLLRKSLIL